MSRLNMSTHYQKIHSIPEFIDAIRLRVDVFIIEQGFKPGWEPDEDDKISEHYAAIAGGKIVCTARVRETVRGEFKIERMVTAKEFRSKGVGRGLVAFILSELKAHAPKRIWLRSQVRSQKFYEKCGFTSVTAPFEMWGVMHIDMESRKTP